MAIVKDLPPEPKLVRPQGAAGKRLVVGILLMQNEWDEWGEIESFFRAAGVEPEREPEEEKLDRLLADLEKHRMVIYCADAAGCGGNRSTFERRKVRRRWKAERDSPGAAFLPVTQTGHL